MDQTQIETLFTGPDGTYRFARWGRAIAPVVFGVDDATVALMRDAAQALCAVCNHSLTETDPELGSNLMFFFCADWGELADLPNLDQMIPDLTDRVAQLKAANANQYRLFRFDDHGAIRACFVFLRMDEVLAKQAADDLALDQMTRVMVTWARDAWNTQSPLAKAGEQAVLRADVADLLRAAYDPVMPAAEHDPTHALRLLARLRF